MQENIVIRGVRQNNLKGFDLTLPRNKLIVFTGLSGCGKSSLAFDTLYAEGQRRYVESLSSYARQFLGQMEKPDVDSIDGLSPAISIDQKTTSKNPRSTVGTVTEIHDYLRLLYARVGVAHCPRCGREISKQTVDQMVDRLLALPERTRMQLLAPIVRGKKGEHVKILENVVKQGFVRVRIDGEICDAAEAPALAKQKKHNIEVVVDRLILREDIRARLTDSLETALSRGVVCLLLCALVAHSGMLHDPGTVTLADCRSLTGKMLRIGVPTGVESSLFSLGKLLVQQLYASLGTVALAANAAAGALSCIATLPGGAISLAMLPAIGQAIGAGKPDEARRLGRKLLAIAYVLMLGTNLLVYIFLPQLSGLYGLTAETTAVVHDLLLWHCIFASLFYPAGFCIPAALRAAGDVRYPMVISVASMLVFRVGLSFVFVRGFGLGVVSIWMAIFVDWGFRAVLFGLRFHSNIWQKKKLL